MGTFMGCRRQHGRFGTRNYAGVPTSVNCSGSVAIEPVDQGDAGRAAPWFRNLKNVDAIVPVVDGTGCGFGFGFGLRG
jgi:altronate dehydratase